MFGDIEYKDVLSHKKMENQTRTHSLAMCTGGVMRGRRELFIVFTHVRDNEFERSYLVQYGKTNKKISFKFIESAIEFYNEC